MKKADTTVSLSYETRRKLNEIKWDLKKKTYDEILNALMQIRKVVFRLEKNGSKREIIGPLIYEKLMEGWEIIGYSVKDESVKDEVKEE